MLAFVQNSGLSQPVLQQWIILIIQLFVDWFRFYVLITPTDVGNAEERVHGSVIQSV